MSTSFDSQPNATPQAGGIDYGAFSTLVVPSAGSFADIYDGGGDTSLTFYQFQGTAPSGGWLPLGDIVGVPSGNLPPGVTFFAAGSGSEAFANPTGFVWLLDDEGSKDDGTVVYWGPVPPTGYVALGICFTNSGDAAPNPANYWCVKQSYLLGVSSYTAWSDSGAGWKNNGDLLAPCLTPGMPESAPPGDTLILPPTLGSAQAGFAAYALVGTQARPA